MQHLIFNMIPMIWNRSEAVLWGLLPIKYMFSELNFYILILYIHFVIGCENQLFLKFKTSSIDKRNPQKDIRGRVLYPNHMIQRPGYSIYT